MFGDSLTFATKMEEVSYCWSSLRSLRWVPRLTRSIFSRCISYTLHHPVPPRWSTHLLPRDVSRPILLQRLLDGLGTGLSNGQRYRLRNGYAQLVYWPLLQHHHKLGSFLFFRIIQSQTTMDQLRQQLEQQGLQNYRPAPISQIQLYILHNTARWNRCQL